MDEFKENLKLFLSKIKKLDIKVYAKISNPERLHRRWKNVSPGSKRERRLEDKLVEIYAKMSDPKQLIKLWRDAHAEDKLMEIIKDRLEEVCATIFDPEQLHRLWEETPVRTKPEKIIKNRAVEMTKAITPDNIPEWFGEIILGKKKIFHFVKIEIIEKAQEIYEFLGRK